MPDNPTPEMLKRMKFDSPAPFPVESATPAPPQLDDPPRNAKSRAVTVEDDDEAAEQSDFAPGGDADYFAEEDEEGRFFGGGLTKEQKEILNIFDNNGGEGIREDVSREFRAHSVHA